MCVRDSGLDDDGVGFDDGGEFRLVVVLDAGAGGGGAGGKLRYVCAGGPIFMLVLGAGCAGLGLGGEATNGRTADADTGNLGSMLGDSTISQSSEE